jgi:hypothetical protein
VAASQAVHDGLIDCFVGIDATDRYSAAAELANNVRVITI